MNEFRISGVTTVGGGVYEDVAIDGVATISGDITCRDISIQGVSTISGNLDCAQLSVEGTCKIKGNVRGVGCKLAGVLTITGDAEAERFTGTGSFQVSGTLNAETVDVKFVYGSGAAEVCGENIHIRKESHSGAVDFIVDMIPWRHKGRDFKCQMIEGDRIDIEYVAAETVRGRDVRIGAGCRIGLVEYHDTLDVAPGASVIQSVKLEA